MIDTIEEFEKKGFRIGIFPQKINGKWLWTAGVYIGEETKANWVDSDNGLPRAGYNSYREAFDAVVNYCTTYKPTRGKQK